MPIYENKNIEIQKKKDNFVLVIKDTPNNKEAKHFWKKTCNLIDFNKKDNTKNIKIIFDAYSIETLPSLLKSKNDKISYRHGELLFLNFLKQIESLEKDGLGIINLDLNDFIIVNKDEARYESIIIFINTDKFYPIENGYFFLKKPSDISKLLSSKFNEPEIKNIKDIPVKLHKKTVYYSFGMLITHCINKENELKKKEDFQLSLVSILESKLYYGIMRCIEKIPDDRYYLYI